MTKPSHSVTPEQPLRIIVADDDPQVLDFYRQMLPTIGHELAATAESGAELIEICRRLKPDLVISDIKMPDMDGLDATEKIYEDTPLPIILISGYHDEETVRRAQQNHVLAYLVKPITVADVQVALGLVRRRFEEFQALQQEYSDLKQALEDRKVIERAKGIIMKRGRLDEHEAFRHLQKMASRENLKLVQISDMIVTAEAAFEPAKGHHGTPRH